MEKSKSEYYGGIDGLRTIACLGIILMHMAVRGNNYYNLPYLVEKITSAFNDFVFLFMTISAFVLCCGYYDKILNNTVDLKEFYKKRYIKILPFFSFIVLLDVIVEFSVETVIEAATDISLTFGLFPNDISVIGVAWYLGLVFAFYMMFPFYCVLISSCKTAWGIMVITVILNYITGYYFGMGRRNIVYSSCFFVLGGLIYLYREKLKTVKAYITLPAIVLAIIFYWKTGNTISCLAVILTLMILAISDCGEKILKNRVTTFISNISLELYLCHMVVFRGIELLGLNTIFGDGMFQYVVTVTLVTVLSILFVVIVKLFWKKVVVNRIAIKG